MRISDWSSDVCSSDVCSSDLLYSCITAAQAAYSATFSSQRPDWCGDLRETRAGFVDLLHSRTRDWTVSKTSKKSLLRSTVAPLILGTTLFASQAFAQDPESSTGAGQAILVKNRKNVV